MAVGAVRRQLRQPDHAGRPAGRQIGRATIRRGPRGLFLCEGYRLKFPIAGAFTIGNVITTGSTWDTMLARFPDLLEHEERHTWQYLAASGCRSTRLRGLHGLVGAAHRRPGRAELLRAPGRSGQRRLHRPPVRPIGENLRAWSGG